MQTFLKRAQSDLFSIADDGLVQTQQLDPAYPTVFCLVVPCNADGEQVEGNFTGTILYEIQTANNESWVSIQADGDFSDLQDSQYRAPTENLRVTLNTPVGFTHYKIRCIQHFL